MAVTVRIPAPLRGLTGGAGEVSVEGGNVRELIANLEAQYPGMRERLCDDSGDLRRFVNVFVGQEDIRFLGGLDTPLSAESEVSIIPAIAGGAHPAASN